jgi:membrane-bound lytic murein transglycosylase A
MLIQKPQINKSLSILAACTVCIYLSGCSTSNIIPDNTVIPSVEDVINKNNKNNENISPSFQAINGWASDDITQAWPAWMASCSKIAMQPMWANVCQKANGINPQDTNAQRAYFENNFNVKQLTTSEQNNINKITGYYQPILKASRIKQGPYLYPIYKYPSAWVSKKPNPMPTREQIMTSNILAGNELFYLDNPIDAAFLQVQGSGQLQLENNTTVKASYAGNNDHAFKSFAGWLINKGEITRDQASIAGMKLWANKNPGKVQEMLYSNPRFIFFKEDGVINSINHGANIANVPSANFNNPLGLSINSEQKKSNHEIIGAMGAIGALGVSLTPMRSIAVDTNNVPLGAPVFLNTTHPGGGEIKKLVMAQDVGNAIKGSIRADYFWGSGSEAGELAGRTNYTGNMWVLLPK